MNDPLSDIPKNLHTAIRNEWDSSVRGGRAKFVAARDGSGSTGQCRISTLLKGAGIGDTDPRYWVVIEHGRRLYYDG